MKIPCKRLRYYGNSLDPRLVGGSRTNLLRAAFIVSFQVFKKKKEGLKSWNWKSKSKDKIVRSVEMDEEQLRDER